MKFPRYIEARKSGSRISRRGRMRKRPRAMLLQKPNLRGVADVERTGCSGTDRLRAAVAVWIQRLADEIAQGDQAGRHIELIQLGNGQLGRSRLHVFAGQFATAVIVRAIRRIVRNAVSFRLAEILGVMVMISATQRPGLLKNLSCRYGRRFAVGIRVRMMPATAEHGVHAQRA